MVSIDAAAGETASVSTASRPADSLRFDLASALLAVWFMAGMFLDGWAHNNGRVDNTFFTPWHAVLYSGYAAVGALTVGAHLRNVLKGYGWTRALPRGYMPSLAGVVLFGFGGLFDFFWHSTFGFEANIEALLSPAHLLLAAGALLFITGPLRAAWTRPKGSGWRDLLPAMLSLLFVLSLLTFFLQYAHFLEEPEWLAYRPSDSRFFVDMFGVVGMVVPGALIVGVTLFALRRWTLPFGMMTLLIGVSSTLMFFMRFGANENYPALLLVGPLAGLFADVLLWRLRPSMERVGALRLFAFLVPFAMFLLHMVLLNASTPLGLWWKIHMWLGVPFVAGIAGFLLTFLVAPPAFPAEV